MKQDPKKIQILDEVFGNNTANQSRERVNDVLDDVFGLGAQYGDTNRSEVVRDWSVPDESMDKIPEWHSRSARKQEFLDHTRDMYQESMSAAVPAYMQSPEYIDMLNNGYTFEQADSILSAGENPDRVQMTGRQNGVKPVVPGVGVDVGDMSKMTIGATWPTTEIGTTDPMRMQTEQALERVRATGAGGESVSGRKGIPDFGNISLGDSVRNWWGDKIGAETLTAIKEKRNSIPRDELLRMQDRENEFREALDNEVKEDNLGEWTVDDLPADADGKVVVGGKSYAPDEARGYIKNYMANKEHERRFTDDDAYRNDWFLKNTGMTEERYRNAVADELELRLADIEQKLPKKALQNTRGGYAAIGGAINNRNSGGGDIHVAASQIEKARKALNTLRKDSFGAGVREGFDMEDILTLGLKGVGDNVALLRALNTQDRGEALSREQQVLVDAWEYSQEAELAISALGGRSLGASIGSGAARSVGFVGQMMATGGVASAATKGLTKAVAKRALQQAVTTGTKGKVMAGLQKGALRVAASFIGAAARVPVAGMGYRNYTDRRLSQFSLGEQAQEDGSLRRVIEKTPSSVWRDALYGGLETLMEFQSEDMGMWIDAGISKIGRKIALSKFGRQIGIGSLTGFKRNAALAWVGREAKIAGFAGETLGEAYGDAMVNLFEGNKEGWRQMMTKEYWWELGGVTLALSGTFKAMNTPGAVDYARHTNALNKLKRQSLAEIENKALKSELASAVSLDNLAARSAALGGVNWKDKSISKEDAVRAVDFINSQTQLDIMQGERGESERLERAMPLLEIIPVVGYRGMDGKQQPEEVISVATQDGGAGFVVAGDLTANKPIEVWYPVGGQRKQVEMTEVGEIKRTGLDDFIATEYALAFGTQATQDQLDRVRSRAVEATEAGVEAESVNEIIRNAGYTVYAPGDEVRTIGGEEVIVGRTLGGAYEIIREDGTTEAYGFNEILQPDARTAEAQMTDAERQDVSESGSDVGASPQKMAVDQVISVVENEVNEAKNRDDDVVYEATMTDGEPVNIIKGTRVVYDAQTGEVDYAASDATVVVRLADGRKKMISIRDIDSIDEVVAAQDALNMARQVAEKQVAQTTSVADRNDAEQEPRFVQLRDGAEGVVEVRNEDGGYRFSTLNEAGEIVVRDIAEEEIASVIEPKEPVEQNPMIGRSLTEEEAARVVSQMQAMAAPAPQIELTPENWTAEFGENGVVKTPIGDVKMGENQYLKLLNRGRVQYFGMIKPTLQTPDVVLEENDPQDGAERNTKLLFIKTFVKPDGGRYVHFESVTIQKDNLEVSISSHEIEPESLMQKMHNDNIMHLNKSFSSSEGRLTEPQNEGSDLVPTPNDSENKDTKNIPESQNKVSEIPRLKNGKPNWNAMSAVQLAETYADLNGYEVAVEDLTVSRKANAGKIDAVQKRLDKEGDLNKRADLREQMRLLQAEDVRLANALGLLGAERGELTQQQRQSNNDRVVELFPEGLPNTYTQALGDIARGQRFVWGDSSDGTKWGVSRELGFVGNEGERRRMLGITATPEKGGVYLSSYIDDLRMENNGYELGLDDQQIRNDVIEALQDAPSAGMAMKRLEEMAARAAKDPYAGMDAEDYEAMLAHKRQQTGLQESIAEGLGDVAFVSNSLEAGTWGYVRNEEMEVLQKERAELLEKRAGNPNFETEYAAWQERFGAFVDSTARDIAEQYAPDSKVICIRTENDTEGCRKLGLLFADDVTDEDVVGIKEALKELLSGQNRAFAWHAAMVIPAMSYELQPFRTLFSDVIHESIHNRIFKTITEHELQHVYNEAIASSNLLQRIVGSETHGDKSRSKQADELIAYAISLQLEKETNSVEEYFSGKAGIDVVNKAISKDVGGSNTAIEIADKLLNEIKNDYERRSFSKRGWKYPNSSYGDVQIQRQGVSDGGTPGIDSGSVQRDRGDLQGAGAELGSGEQSVGKSAERTGESIEDDYTRKDFLIAERSQIESQAKADGTWLMAPNGNPTNLNERQWVEVRTKAFKRWFGDWERNPSKASKVLDENGEPAVMYHGSPSRFNEFRQEFIGSNGTAWGQGFYFTPQEEMARGYTADGGRLFEVYLNIRKTLSTERITISRSQYKKFIDALDQYVPENGEERIDILSNYGDVEYDGRARVLNDAVKLGYEGSGSDVGLVGSLINASGDYSAVEFVLKSTLGYDGIIAPNGAEFVVMNPADIKSATENTGGFDPSDPDIRFVGPFSEQNLIDRGDSSRAPSKSKREQLIDQLRQTIRESKQSVRATAQLIGDRVRKSLGRELVEVMGKRDFDALIRQIENATGRQDVEGPLRRIAEIVLDLEIRRKQDKIEKLLKLRVQGQTSRGVSIAATVDDKTRQFFEVIRDNLTRPAKEVQAMLEERGAELDAKMGAQLLENYQTAQAYGNDVADINRSISVLIGENTAFRKSRAEDNKAGRTKEAIAKSKEITNNQQIIEALQAERVKTKEFMSFELSIMSGELDNRGGEGREIHSNWLEQREEHKRELINAAFRDMGDGKRVPILDRKVGVREKGFRKIREFFLSPAYSLNYLLKMVSVNAPKGEGAIYDHFMRGEYGYVASRARYYQGYEDFKAKLDVKAHELFGKSYLQVMADSNNPADATITILDGKTKEEYSPTIGEALYVYMADKMVDGKVKLRKMGIRQEHVDMLAGILPSPYVQFADWIQNAFLPDRRKAYNETHLEAFGTQMAEIENYIPLKILKGKIYQEVDGTKTDVADLPSAITGSIIRRRRNAIAIDLHTNVFDLMLEHGQHMEHWNAFTRIVQDVNSLLSSTALRRMLEARNPGLHKKLKIAAQIASDNYRPETNETNRAWVALGKLSAASKIAFRLNTALKQVLSYPAFYAYSSDVKFWGYLTKNLSPTTWAGNFRWSLENIPSFRERWRGRMAGNEKLAQMTAPQLDKWIASMSQWGMFPNALVDAITCANGSKAVYDFRVEEYRSAGYDDVGSVRRAKIDAALAMNETQQSGEGMYLSRIQVERDFWSVSLSTFQNSNFAYFRKQLEAIDELRRNVERERKNRADYYEEQGLSDDEAWEAAMRDVVKAKKGAITQLATFMFVMNVLWGIGNNVWRYLFSDNDDDLGAEMAKSAAISVIRNTSIGPLVESVADGHDMNPSVLLSDMIGFTAKMSQIMKQDDPKAWDRTAAYIALQTLTANGVGIDMNSFVTMYEGLTGILRDGADMEDVMLLLNAPRSQARLIAGEPKDGESLDDYQRRQGYIERRIQANIDKTQLGKWARNYAAYQQARILGVETLRDVQGRVGVPRITKLDDTYTEVLKEAGLKRNGYSMPDANPTPERQEIFRAGMSQKVAEIAYLQKQMDKMVVFNDEYSKKLKQIQQLKQEVIDAWKK